MKARRIAVLVAAIVTLSFMMLATVNASTFPSLPSGEVTLQLTLGPTKWPGSVTFSGIVGGPYDVVNSQPYTAWCANFYAEITTAPDSYASTLSSSIGVDTTWNKVNYLLNHNTDKDMDVQVALWLLLGANTADITARYPEQPSSTAIALYNDAEANGAGFTPGSSEILAVICTVPGYQTLIIELTKPHCSEDCCWDFRSGCYTWGCRSGCYNWGFRSGCYNWGFRSGCYTWGCRSGCYNWGFRSGWH